MRHFEVCSKWQQNYFSGYGNSFVTISLVLSTTPSWYGMEVKILKLYNVQEKNTTEKLSFQKSIKRKENTN